MTVLPRFKYFISLRSLIRDLICLIFSDMSNRKDVEKFERRLCTYFDREHCLTTSSYRMCVYYYLKSLKLNPGDEILLSPITIADLINVILILELKPVFIDIDVNTHNISFESLRKSVTQNSKAIIVTYLSGMVGEMNSIVDFCRENKIKIIEDISQAYGSKLPTGRDPFLGDLQAGSLSSGKLISTYTGGFALSNDKLLIEKINAEREDESSPPKIRFYSEIFNNIKINIATSKIFFPLVYFVFSLLWKFKPSAMKALTNTKFHTRSEKYDVFFDDYPIRRNEIPSGWRTYLCSWQARVGLRFLSEINKRMTKRQCLGEIFYSHLNSNVKKRIPRLALNDSFNFYHIPFSLTKEKEVELVELFKIGVDTEGYGLNFCSQEIAFSEYSKSLDGAYHTKNNSVFLPLHESYSPKSIITIAKRLNSLHTEEKRHV